MRMAGTPGTGMEATMQTHKYRVGQTVDFFPARKGTGPGSSRCEILRLLPLEGEDPQYRVKCQTEGFERVLRESQLSETVRSASELK
jgi:hypothetical protein